MPLHAMAEMSNVEENARVLKERFRAEAAAYGSERRTSGLPRSSGLRALPQQFVEQMLYIEEVIFSGNAQSLTRTESEMMLLRALGTSYTTQTLDYVLSTASRRTHVSQSRLNATVCHILQLTMHFICSRPPP